MQAHACFSYGMQLIVRNGGLIRGEHAPEDSIRYERMIKNGLMSAARWETLNLAKKPSWALGCLFGTIYRMLFTKTGKVVCHCHLVFFSETASWAEYSPSLGMYFRILKATHLVVPLVRIS